MTKETIRRLKNLRVINTEIMSKRQEILELRTKIYKNQKFVNLPKSDGIGNGSENLNLKIISDTERITDEINALYDEKKLLTNAIDSLEDGLERNIIRLYYINRYTWEEIAREFNCSKKTAQIIRNAGVEKLEKLLRTFS